MVLLPSRSRCFARQSHGNKIDHFIWDTSRIKRKPIHVIMTTANKRKGVILNPNPFFMLKALKIDVAVSHFSNKRIE